MKKNKNEGKVLISCRISEHLAKMIQVGANAEKRTRAAEVEKIIERYFEKKGIFRGGGSHRKETKNHE